MSGRVIAGSAKGRRLKLVPGDSTRPIMDRVKEALFSIIGRDIINAKFLDLFAGTGSVGIEALSRGAERVVFVEKHGLAVKTIQDNLASTKLSDKAIIRRTDVFAFLAAAPEHYDFIYIAPPQYKGLWLDTLKAIEANAGWLSDETVVIVQIDPNEYTPIESDQMAVYDERKYGKTLLVFLKRKEDADE